MDWLRQHAPWVSDSMAAVALFFTALGFVILEAVRWLWLARDVASLKAWRRDHSAAADKGFERIGAVEGRIAQLSGQFRVISEGQAAMDRRASDGLARIEGRLDAVTEQFSSRIEGLEDRIATQIAAAEQRSNDNFAAVIARIDGLYRK